MSRAYPNGIHTYDGWGVIAEGHGLSDTEQLAAIHEYDQALVPIESQAINAQEVHFGYAPRVKWCGENYGASCDQEGDWHSHWYAIKPNANERTKFTILHVVDKGVVL